MLSLNAYMRRRSSEHPKPRLHPRSVKGHARATAEQGTRRRRLGSICRLGSVPFRTGLGFRRQLAIAVSDEPAAGVVCVLCGCCSGNATSSVARSAISRKLRPLPRFAVPDSAVVPVMHSAMAAGPAPGSIGTGPSGG